jgi:hypothetical protein
MHLARWILIVFFLVAIMVTYSPQTQTIMSQVWEQARPGVLETMDSLYAAIRDFVAGSGTQDNMEDKAPGVDFDIIITKETKGLS